MKKYILIIEKNTSGIIGLKKAKERGLHVIYMTSNKFTKVSSDEMNYIDEVIEIDTNNIELTIQKCIELKSKMNIVGVMTFLEYSVPVAAHVAKALNLPGISIESANLTRNKYLMREALSRGNVPIPIYKPVQSLDEANQSALSIGFPNVIKVINMASSRNVFENNNMQDLEKHFGIVVNSQPPGGVKKEDICLIEEYLEGQEFSVETVYFNGQTHIINLTKKIVKGDKTFVEIGHVVPTKLDINTQENIYKVIRAAIDALGLNFGVTHTEFKLTAEGPKIVEIAARLGGDHIPEIVELALGIDLWDISISLALNEKVDLTPKKNAGAVIYYYTANPGEIERIEGVEHVKDLPGIRKVSLEVEAGNIVNRLESSNDRLGYIIATGNDAQEAELTAQNGIKLTKFIIKEN